MTPLGRREAALTAQRLADWGPFHALHSSPLGRAHETACIIGSRLGLRPLLHDDLRELNVGELDGLGSEEAEACCPGVIGRWRSNDPALIMPRGEAISEFHLRARRAFDRLFAVHPHGHVMVVSHVCLISAYLTQLFEARPSIRLAWEMWNCAITQLELVDGAVRLRRFNDHAHVQHLYPAKG